jgi:ATP-binding cassette, subfamily A (ABC1), member 3
LIGNPPIVLLDEPSTGVDPQAKRFMWTIIQNISTRNKKSTVVLTTHSMDEAEALCPKIGIMVEGKFKCFGSAQYLKNKYGMGYELEVKIKNLDAAKLQEQKKNCATGDFVKADEIRMVLQKLGAQDLEEKIFMKGSGKEINRMLKLNK